MFLDSGVKLAFTALVGHPVNTASTESAKVSRPVDGSVFAEYVAGSGKREGIAATFECSCVWRMAH